MLKNIGQSIWQVIFNKITTDQLLNEKESIVYNLATKASAIFSMQEKLQHPLDRLAKVANGMYVKEQQDMYLEEYGYQSKVSGYLYDNEQIFVNDNYLAA